MVEEPQGDFDYMFDSWSIITVQLPDPIQKLNYYHNLEWAIYCSLNFAQVEDGIQHSETADAER